MMKKDDSNQEFLRKLDHFDQAGGKIMSRLMVVLYVLFTCCILVGTVYYGVREFRGNGDSEQLAICCVTLLVLAALPVCNKLADRFLKHLGQKNHTFDPSTMALPAQGAVTLEDALHRMSTQTGVIVWDTIWGCVVFSLLFLLALGMGNRPRILLVCVCVTILLALGHAVFHLLWKKKSFTKRMLRNTSKIMELTHPEAYGEAVEESLKQGVLSYEKELILTNEYILGRAEWDTYYRPVAISRAQITEFTFFYQRMVGGRSSRTVGILRCSADGKKLVDFVLGPQPKAERILKILSYYQFSWQEGKLTYV